jgi:hypothetical protein
MEKHSFKSAAQAAVFASKAHRAELAHRGKDALVLLKAPPRKALRKPCLRLQVEPDSEPPATSLHSWSKGRGLSLHIEQDAPEPAPTLAQPPIKQTAQKKAMGACVKRKLLKLQLDLNAEVDETPPPDSPAPTPTWAQQMDGDLAEADQEGPADLGNDTITLKELGRGAGGCVHLGLYVPRLTIVAVKEISVLDDNVHSMMVQELHSIHENLVPIDPSSGARWCSGEHSAIGAAHPCRHLVSFYGAFSDRANMKVLVHDSHL